MNTRLKNKINYRLPKRPKFLNSVPYSSQAISCVACAVASFILLFFNLIFSVAFSILSFVFFTKTKPRSKLDYNDRWFATMGVILALTSLTVVILTHIIVNSIFGMLLQ